MEPKLIDVVTFHRAYLETAAIAVSAHSHTSWLMLRRLLDARGGVDLRSVPVHRVLDPADICKEVGRDDPGNDAKFNFHQMAIKVSERGHGVLLGWQRLEDEMVSGYDENASRKINPNDKLTPMKWSAHDMLIVVTRMDDDANADGDDEVEDDDKDPMSA